MTTKLPLSARVRRSNDLRARVIVQSLAVRFTGGQFLQVRYLTGHKRPMTQSELAAWVQGLVDRELLRNGVEVLR